MGFCSTCWPEGQDCATGLCYIYKWAAMFLQRKKPPASGCEVPAAEKPPAPDCEVTAAEKLPAPGCQVPAAEKPPAPSCEVLAAERPPAPGCEVPAAESHQLLAAKFLQQKSHLLPAAKLPQRKSHQLPAAKLLQRKSHCQHLAAEVLQQLKMWKVWQVLGVWIWVQRCQPGALNWLQEVTMSYYSEYCPGHNCLKQRQLPKGPLRPSDGLGVAHRENGRVGERSGGVVNTGGISQGVVSPCSDDWSWSCFVNTISCFCFIISSIRWVFSFSCTREFSFDSIFCSILEDTPQMHRGIWNLQAKWS